MKEAARVILLLAGITCPTRSTDRAEGQADTRLRETERHIDRNRHRQRIGQFGVNGRRDADDHGHGRDADVAVKVRGGRIRKEIGDVEGRGESDFRCRRQRAFTGGQRIERRLDVGLTHGARDEIRQASCRSDR